MRLWSAHSNTSGLTKCGCTLQAVQLPVSQAAAGYMDDSGPADSPPAVTGDMAPRMAPSLAPSMVSNMAPAWAPRLAPAPAPHRAHAPAPAPTRARCAFIALAQFSTYNILGSCSPTVCVRSEDNFCCGQSSSDQSGDSPARDFPSD